MRHNDIPRTRALVWLAVSCGFAGVLGLAACAASPSGTTGTPARSGGSHPVLDLNDDPYPPPTERRITYRTHDCRAYGAPLERYVRRGDERLIDLGADGTVDLYRRDDVLFIRADLLGDLASRDGWYTLPIPGSDVDADEAWLLLEDSATGADLPELRDGQNEITELIAWWQRRGRSSPQVPDPGSFALGPFPHRSHGSPVVLTSRASRAPTGRPR